LKWELCHNAPGPKKYMICNADEGDPGAFMDRSILEADPHSVLEGLIIAGFAIGADEGYIYVRAEYPLAVKRFRIAIKQAEEKGFLGTSVMGTGFSFRMNVMEGAGAFVCGEETALISSLEGKSGRPRPRPPFPVHSGLWGKPTTIDNVKTLASVTRVMLNGPDWYSKIGTEKCTGTAVFALTGQVANIGLVEVPMGTPLSRIIYDIGGGIPKGKAFKAVQTGGPSGGCLPARHLKLSVDYSTLTEAGSMMGSGGMVVMDEDTCIVEIARYFLDFAQKESCGECVPCRLGTKQMLSILEDITKGKGAPEDIDLLLELAQGIKLGSLCGLGKTAPNPVLTTIRYFRDEYEAHVKRKQCPAVVCKEIISSACHHTCPIGQEASTYIALVAQGKYEDAFEVILKDNPLPSSVARVCHHPCEAKCQAGKWAEPISIRGLKRFVTDYALENDLYPKETIRLDGGSSDTGKIAIIGAGPAGLTAGFRLASKGYDTTIFEASDVPGGALALCIPEYRLPRNILSADLDYIKTSGLKIRTRTRIGVDISFGELLKGHKALFIATGAHKSRKLRIENEEAEGVLDALEVLRDINLNRKVKISGKVGIIGGGNAAIDAARCVKRLKSCETVTILYRRTRREMPAFKEEIEAAIEEGVAIQLLTAPTRIIAENGKMSGVECIQMELGEPDMSGRRRPIPVEGSEFVVALDTLIVAIGQDPDLSFLGKEPELKISKEGTIDVDGDTHSTNIPGVFAGGDAVTGASTVTDAMSAGKAAADMIEKYIKGQNLAREYTLTRPSLYVQPVELTEEEIESAKRPEIPCIPIAQRSYNYGEVDLTFGEDTAIEESRRCLRCDLETEDAQKWMAQRQPAEVKSNG
jgi:NADH-quinone oxidoreductase subunit F